MIALDDDALFVLRQMHDGRWCFSGEHPYPLLSVCSAYIWHTITKGRDLRDMDYLDQWLDSHSEAWFAGVFSLTQHGEENGKDQRTGTAQGP